MSPLRRVLERAVPALLMASSVALLSAGVFAFAPPLDTPDASPPVATGRPTSPPVPSPVAGLPTPRASAMPSVPAVSPSAVPASATPGLISTPRPTAMPPSPSIVPTPTPAERARATRIVIPSLDIDLAVVPGDLEVPGNRDDYPLCDVAQSLVGFREPGELGTTYIYAHARRGMFLPLLNASQRNDGAGMIGSLVEVYTSANQLHLYEIYVVKRHATDLSLALELPAGGEQLVLQTSEGPAGTIPKLQVAALPISVVPADPDDANPRPRPRACPP